MRRGKQGQAQPSADTRQPVGISYIRFSSGEQRKGDSRRRQTADTAAWCERNVVPLDDKLSCLDAGRSAFHGRNRDDKAALGRFLELVREGKVPRGSYLVIENLDRLSREDARTALRLWLDILDAGINIVQLHPETTFHHDKSDMVDIMRAIIELSRGHSESRMKSVRSLANWNEAVKLARQGQEMKPRRADGRRTKSITSRLPGWIEERDGILVTIPERVVVVKRIFEMATTGYGMTTIVAKLAKEEVPAFGDRILVEDEGGGPYWRAADGERYGAGEWRTAYVRSILSDRRAIGELQPCDRDDNPKGDPIPNYYPAAVTPAEFYAARAAISNRRNRGSDQSKINRQGRIGKGVASLFGGLLKHARNPGETYYVAARSEKGVTTRALLNSWSRERKATAYTYPYDTFERAVLRCLREIDPKEIVSPVPVTTVSVLQGELDDLRERKVALALALRDVGKIASVAVELAAVEAREQELLAQMDDNAERVAAPRSDAWGTMQSLIDVLDAAEDPEDVRLRLRAALRRTVSAIHVLVVPCGRDRLCVVQMDFPECPHRRNYIIWRRPPLGNARYGEELKRVPGWWCVSSSTLLWQRAVYLPAEPPDLGTKEGAEQVEVAAKGWDLEVVFKGAERHPLP